MSHDQLCSYCGLHVEPRVSFLDPWQPIDPANGLPACKRCIAAAKHVALTNIKNRKAAIRKLRNIPAHNRRVIHQDQVAYPDEGWGMFRHYGQDTERIDVRNLVSAGE